MEFLTQLVDPSHTQLERAKCAQRRGRCDLLVVFVALVAGHTLAALGFERLTQRRRVGRPGIEEAVFIGLRGVCLVCAGSRYGALRKTSQESLHQ